MGTNVRKAESGSEFSTEQSERGTEIPSSFTILLSEIDVEIITTIVCKLFNNPFDCITPLSWCNKRKCISM